ncbi:hypothetical protein BASA62_004189 [Batrachochytrium salamandrivorans]|nr:hypothetical protein BASA62_004189 [Batrachochytrium salamandrivorans]
MPTALTHSYWADVDSDSDLDDIDDIDAIAVAIAEANSCLLHVNAVPGGSALDPARNTAAAATLHGSIPTFICATPLATTATPPTTISATTPSTPTAITTTSVATNHTVNNNSNNSSSSSSSNNNNNVGMTISTKDAPSNTIVVTSPDTNVNAAPVALHSLAGLFTDPSISTSTSTLASQSIDSIISPLISPLVSSFISPFVSPLTSATTSPLASLTISAPTSPDASLDNNNNSNNIKATSCIDNQVATTSITAMNESTLSDSASNRYTGNYSHINQKGSITNSRNQETPTISIISTTRTVSMLSVSSTTPNAVQPLSRSPSPSPSATHLLPQSHPERPSPIRAPVKYRSMATLPTFGSAELGKHMGFSQDTSSRGGLSRSLSISYGDVRHAPVRSGIQRPATTTASRTSSDSSYDSKRGHYSGLTPSPMDCAPRLSPTDQSNTAISYTTLHDTHIDAIFVAHFNTHRGNIIEYQFPTHASIAGVEYKSIPSGAHAIAQDVIYFSCGPGRYGVAALENVALSSTGAEEERGARIKAVGIVLGSYTGLHSHLPFLRQQVARFVRNQGSLDDLTFYCLNHQSRDTPILNMVESISVSQFRIGHPASHLPGLLNAFKAKIFVLWKYTLLQKRILFYGQPPVQQSSHNVFCTMLLASHSVLSRFHIQSNPQFFINVADIDYLSTLSSYIACTTEKIFSTKTTLFDAYIEDTKITSYPIVGSRHTRTDESRFAVESDADLQRYVALKRAVKYGTIEENSSDLNSRSTIAGQAGSLPMASSKNLRSSLAIAKGRFKKWTSHMKSIRAAGLHVHTRTASTDSPLSTPYNSDFSNISYGGVSETSFDASESNTLSSMRIIEFFDRLNTNLFDMLLLIERSRDPVVRPCRIQNLLQLHSVHDLVFVTELVRVHRMNITIETSHWKTKRWSTMQQVQPPLKVPAQPLPQTLLPDPPTLGTPSQVYPPHATGLAVSALLLPLPESPPDSPASAYPATLLNTARSPPVLSSLSILPRSSSLVLANGPNSSGSSSATLRMDTLPPIPSPLPKPLADSVTPVPLFSLGISSTGKSEPSLPNACSPPESIHSGPSLHSGSVEDRAIADTLQDLSETLQVQGLASDLPSTRSSSIISLSRLGRHKCECCAFILALQTV